MNCKQYQDKLQLQAQNDAAARETSNTLKVRGGGEPCGGQGLVSSCITPVASLLWKSVASGCAVCRESRLPLTS